MDSDNYLTTAKEFQVYLENAIIRLFIGDIWSPETDAQIFLKPLHTHISTEIFVCLKGIVVLKTEKGYLELYPEDAAVVPKGIPHIKHYSSPETVGYAFFFDCQKNDNRNCDNLYKTFLPLINSDSILVCRSIPNLNDEVERIILESRSTSVFLPALYFAELLLKLCTCSFSEKEKIHQKFNTQKIYDIPRTLALDQFIRRVR